jgi:RNA polymerase sigma factor (sigma-70 family)
MSNRCSGFVLPQFRTLFDGGTLVGMSEVLLLDRFVAHRDEAAFEAIVSRHGPMVLGVCRRVLDDPGDIEDAFQATFLVLVRRAGTLRNPELLANWLYGVAHRVSVRARTIAFRRRLHERPGSEEIAMPDEPREDRAELRAVLDDELSRLPDRLRAVVVLCDLEGAPQEVAARQLGCPLGTIKSRLFRARDRLRGRLVRRGVTPSCLPVGSWLAREANTTAVPLKLLASTMRAALDLASGAAISVRIAVLVDGIARSMTRTTISVAATRALATIFVAAGALAIGARITHDNPPPVVAPEILPTPMSVRSALKTWWDGIETLEFREVESPIGTDGRPVQSGHRAVVEVALGRGDRRAVLHGSLEPDGRVRAAQEKRDDGRTQIHLMKKSATTPDEITDVSITRQMNTRDAYHDEDGMCTVLWLLTPWTSGLGLAAQPLYQHLENPHTATSFDVGRDANGKPTVTLRLANQGQRYELDPDHDYLPRRVTGFLHDVTVTRFAKINDRWFPVEGLVTHHAHGLIGEKSGTFVVTDLRINRPIPDSRFEMPPELGKVRVRDFTRGQ